MNQGLYPDEIIDQIQLPRAISESPFFNEFYGTVRWSVRSIFNGYLGWFSGNISDLDPTPAYKKAELMSEMIGGSENLFQQLKIAVNKEEMQWALELSDLLLEMNHKSEEVTALRSKAAYFLGEMSANPNKRNFFLTEAQNLAGKKNYQNIAKPEAAMLNEISIDLFFDVLSVSLNPNRVKESDLTAACFIFSSGEIRTIIIRNQIAQIIDYTPSSCDFTVNTSEEVLKAVLAGIKNPITAITGKEIQVEKKVEFLKFLTNFRP